MAEKWLSTGYLSAKPSGRIDRENGIIEGVKVCTEGQASGHGVHLDGEFIEAVVEKGNEKKQGLKARFGHPNMCSTALGTFLGRHKNFRTETTRRDDGSKALTAVADLFLSNEAKSTPNGDLYGYVINMAENEPDMFGESIVFTPGDYYRRTKSGKKARHQYQIGKDGETLRNSDGQKAFKWVDEKGDDIDTDEDPIIHRDYVECKTLHACDVVDDPAANDGLFSRFSQETIAGQITEFLDLHPQIWDVLEANPQVIEAIAAHGAQADEFFRRYNETRTKGAKPMNPDKAEPAAEENLETAELEEVEVVAESTETPEAAEPEPEAEDTEQEQSAATIDRAEFEKLLTEFGAEIASQVILSGGGMAEAYKLRAEAAEKRAKDLEAQLSAKGSGGTAAKPSEGEGKKKSIW
jgi:hypothetical protein